MIDARTDTPYPTEPLDAEDVAVERALREAVRAALRQHKRAGTSIVVWQDGQIVEIPASKIQVDGE
jgi:hypothetical protein